MKTVPMKSGGFVNLLEEGDKPISGEVNFTGKELAWARKLGVSTNDPEAEREFWKMLIEKKKADESYSLFADFPEVGSNEPAVPTYTGTPSATDARIHLNPRKPFPGEAICRETIEMLKGRGARTRAEREGA